MDPVLKGLLVFLPLFLVGVLLVRWINKRHPAAQSTVYYAFLGIAVLLALFWTLHLW